MGFGGGFVATPFTYSKTVPELRHFAEKVDGRVAVTSVFFGHLLVVAGVADVAHKDIEVAVVVLPVAPTDSDLDSPITLGGAVVRVESVVVEVLGKPGAVVLDGVVRDNDHIVFTDIRLGSSVEDDEMVAPVVVGSSVRERMTGLDNGDDGKGLVLVDGVGVVLFFENPHILSDDFLFEHSIACYGVTLVVYQRPCRAETNSTIFLPYRIRAHPQQ